MSGDWSLTLYALLDTSFPVAVELQHRGDRTKLTFGELCFSDSYFECF